MARAHLCPDMPVPKLCKAMAVSLGLLAGSLLFSAAQAQTAQAPADAAPGFVTCVRSSNCVDSRIAAGVNLLGALMALSLPATARSQRQVQPQPRVEKT